MRRFALVALTLLGTLPVLAVAHPPASNGQSQPVYSPAPAAAAKVYWVYYRSCPQSPWVCYGGYYQPSQAAQAVRYFEYNGYDCYYTAGR